MKIGSNGDENEMVQIETKTATSCCSAADESATTMTTLDFGNDDEVWL